MLMRIPLRFFTWLSLVAAAALCSGERAWSRDPWIKVAELSRDYCVDCHWGDQPSGQLAFDDELLSPTSLGSKATPQTRRFWERVAHKLHVQQMPPLDETRPTSDEYQAVYHELARRLDQLAQKHPLPGSPAAMRRLTRFEYQCVIRDLLGVEIDAARWLPADDASHGFDNVTVGGLSPTLLNRYVTAAQQISRIALGGPLQSPGGRTFRLPGDLTQERHLDGLPLGTRGGGVFRYTFPRDGEYEVSVRLARDRNEQVEGLRGRHQLLLLLDRSQFGEFTVRRPPDNNHSLVDAHLRQRFKASAGVHDLSVTFRKHSSPLLSTLRQPYDARFNYHRHPRTMPAVFQVSITGPFGASQRGDAPSRRQLLVCKPPEGADQRLQRECAREALGALMRRAYRRPVEPADFEQPMRFFEAARGDFERGLELAITSVLASPNFLFRIESKRQDAGAAGLTPLTGLELASRLSFFLWSSVPDEQLLRAAVSGELEKPERLVQEARRMLRDPRADALVENFASQWLYLRNLKTLTPDSRAFPDFDHNLRVAFREETELFFDSIVREDRSILELVSADYTFLNERLAKHYQISNIYGDQMRRVQRPQSVAGPRRGGLLRHGSILTVTSYATRTSPVLRGNWVLENLLNAPPPPPPNDVPALKEKTFDNRLSVRERLAEHRDNPACASCHDLMDPVGFALENYDAVGRWRDHESGLPLDTRGSLTTGTQFDGVTELEQRLLEHPDWLASCVTKKLLTYALGRGIEPPDGAAVRSVVRRAAAKQYRFSSLIEAIVVSDPFRFRGASSPHASPQAAK